MSGVLHKLKHFKKALNDFNFPAEKDEIKRIHDQFALIELKRVLSDVIKESQDDFEVSYDELKEIQSNCKQCHDDTLEALVRSIASYCLGVITDRNTSLKNLLDFIYNCKMISNPALIDLTKIDPLVSIIFKKLYGTEDMVAYILAHKPGKLYEKIYKFPFFSQEEFRQLSAKCLQDTEQRLSLFSSATKQVETKPSSYPIFSPRFAEKIKAAPMAAASAPTSPTKVDAAQGGRSKSVPNSAKAKRATERLPPVIPSPERGRSSSEAIFAAPAAVLYQQRKESSTSSTVLLADSNELADDFFRLALGPSSKSEDDSDERKMQALKEKDTKAKADKRHHSKKK